MPTGMRFAVGLGGKEKKSAAAGGASKELPRRRSVERFVCCLKVRIFYGSQRARRKGRTARLVGTSRHWRSSGVLTLPKFVAEPQRAGMRSSLQGKRARLAGELHFPIGVRHGSRYGQTVIVESEIQSINAPT